MEKTKVATKKPALDQRRIEVTYAEQVGAINVGPFVSKIQFIDVPGGGKAPYEVANIHMPTVALLNLAKELLSMFGKDEVMRGFKGNYGTVIEMLESFQGGKGRSSTSSLSPDVED